MFRVRLAVFQDICSVTKYGNIFLCELDFELEIKQLLVPQKEKHSYMFNCTV